MKRELWGVNVGVFSRNKLAAFNPYVLTNEVVPHPWDPVFLERKEDGSLTSRRNSCIHRGYPLVLKRQTLSPGENIVCEFHNWAYRQGELVAAPGFDIQVSDIPCRNLKEVSLVNLCDFWFDESTVGAGSDIAKFFDHPNILDIWFPDYSFCYETKTDYRVSWQVFLEIYLDGYHVTPVHPGLGTYLVPDKMEWYTGREFSLQVNELCLKDTKFPRSEAWGDFRNEVAKAGWKEKWGALFGTIYPGLMIEFYPHIICVSQIVPNKENTSLANYVQVFSDSSVGKSYLEAFRIAYNETAEEDSILQDRLQRGRYGNLEGSSYPLMHTELEAGLPLLNTWLTQNFSKTTT